MNSARKLVLSAMMTIFATAPLQAAELTLSFANLPALDESSEGIYEGWVIVDGAPVTTGVFNVNAMGQTVAPGTSTVISFSVDDSIGLSSAVKITIEPVGDIDPAPSGLVVMTGDVTDSVTPLVAALPDLATLMTAGGSYILATPSDNGVDTSNDNQGIWYLSMPGPTAGLTNLPDLGPNWTYEGWIVDTSGAMPVPYSTGTFNTATGADSDAAGCNAGGPPFPGQDFTAFHCGPVFNLDSGDFVAVISIEPVPDNGPGPFQFKPLVGMVPTDALANGGVLGNQTAATFPTGNATITGTVATEESTWGGIKASYR
ncbi:MAG: hypothetical protein ACI9UQ_001896 [Candidatus Krumholzibacteriia bacterium]|jgi:hypothetical protein